ncbi:kelch domain-containing protein 7A [Rana temporaria]|uniref:kelch domain-containing protein 7A n=1 Tax=Rana temporaria TaxID=8407 RepID=UPI001AACE3C2|nr:kelch domain-containing protein 7A [Rana temporaria]
MINTTWESKAWQLDMQLVGKVVLSAAALFLLGLAYRLYKFRAQERCEPSDRRGPDLGSAGGDVTDSPQPGLAGDESSNLRFRRVNSNLQNGLVTDPGRKPLAADSSLGTHKVHITAQEGFETADVINRDQNDYGGEATEELRNNSDPLQSQRHRGDDTTGQKDECDGLETVNKTQSVQCREDPEGREMLERSELVKDPSERLPKNITALSSIDLSSSHQNERKQELHRFSSTSEVQMQEGLTTEDGNALQTLLPEGLRGKIYNYHVESTSHSVTALNTLGIGDDSLQSPLSRDDSLQSPLSRDDSLQSPHIPASEEEKEMHRDLKDLVEATKEETKGEDSNQELHRFSSTSEAQMQEGPIAEDGKDGNALQTLVLGGLKGKIYDHHIESTSQSVTALNTLDTGDDSPQSPLSRDDSPQAPLSRDDSPCTPLSRDDSPWTPLSRDDSPWTPLSRDDSPRTPLSRDDSRWTPLFRDDSQQTPLSRDDSPRTPLLIITPAEEKETHMDLKDLVETTEEETKGDDMNQVAVLLKQHPTSDSNMRVEGTDFDGDPQQTTSQSVTKVCAPQSELTYIKTNLPTLEENEAAQTSVENTADDFSNKTPDKANLLQEQDFSNDNNEEQQAESQVTSSGDSAAANLTTSFSNTVDQNIGAALRIQTGPGPYNVSLTPESVSDIRIDLGNCYEVLCLAKKHNLETLKTAAYNVMSKDYLQVLQNPSIYGRLNATERDLILEGRMEGRQFVVVADIDTQATSAAQNKSSLSYYDIDNDAWHSLSQIPIEAVSRGSSMSTMFNYLFIVLGCDGIGREMKPSRRVLCYNPLTHMWKEISPLNEGRPHCKLVALNGFLYAIGGECLHTVERYDPRQNRWSYVAPLPNDTFAVAHMATACDDEIFVTGGTFRYMLLRYREREKVWKNSLVSGSKDRTTEMVASKSFLYRFDLNRNMGISVHRCNIRARIWYECATYAMPYPAPFQCVVIDNNIHCLSRNFHLRFLAEDVSPKFVDTDLQTVPSPKGVLFPLVLVLPVKGTL